MKKSLLILAAAALIAAPAAANDYFTVSLNGNTVANGAEVTVLPDEIDREDGTAKYEPHFVIRNTQAAPRNVYYGMYWTGQPTLAQNESDYSWGVPGICFENAMTPEGDLVNNCTTMPMTEQVVIESDDYLLTSKNSPETLTLLVELTDAAIDKVSKYELRVIALTDELEEIEGGEFSCTIVYTADDAHVGTLGSDQGPAQYFDLLGRRVANPDKGIYIKRQAGKASKVAL